MPKYYLLDENKNLVEGFDKEGFLALLEQAIEQGSLENIDENSAVASKIRSVLNGTTHHIEFVTQAQFNQLQADEQLVANTYYFITDDQDWESLEQHIAQYEEHVTELEAELENGSFIVNKAENAQKTSLTNNGFEEVNCNASGYFNLEADTFYYIYLVDETSRVSFGLVYIHADTYQDPMVIYRGITALGFSYQNDKQYLLQVIDYHGGINIYKDNTKMTSGTLYAKKLA